MVHLKSFFPPPPPVLDSNVHSYMFGTDNAEGIADYTLHVDAITGKKRSFHEFRERVRDGATALGAPVALGGLGLSAEAGDIVGIYSSNCSDYIALVHALLYITTPISLLSAYATPFELTHASRTSKLTRLFVEPALLGKVLKSAKEIGLPEDRIYILEGRHTGVKSFQDLIDNVRKRRIPRVALRPAKRDTLAYLVFSSGTSGLPKAVMISHGNLWATMLSNARLKEVEDEFQQVVPSESPPIWLLFLPFYHTYGVHISCFRNFTTPNTYVIVPRWDVELVLRSIPRFAVQVLPLVPSAAHQLVNHKLTPKTDLSSLLYVNSGAAYLPPALEVKIMSFMKTIPQVSEGYGMSEHTLSSIRKPVQGLFGIYAKPGCTGILLPGMEAKIIREDGSDAQIGEPGELWLKGDNVALGYFGNEKATRETFVDGWLRTGDSFKVDKDGLFYFVDRAKDTLKVSGAQVSPTEIEDVLRAHPDKLIADVSVAGVSGGRTSDEKNPRAWIVLSEAGRSFGPEKTVQTLDAWVKQNLSKYKWIRGGYEITDQIPKSPTGKVLRRLLTNMYEQRYAEGAKL